MEIEKGSEYYREELGLHLSILGSVYHFSDAGKVIIKENYNLFDVSSIVMFGMGAAGIVYSVKKDVQTIVYLVSGLFIGVALTATIIGYIRSKNNFFEFNPSNQVIRFCQSINYSPRSFPTTEETSMQCEIDTLGSGAREIYSATFYCQKHPEEKPEIVLQLNSRHKDFCVKAAQSLLLYMKESTSMRDLSLKEN